MPSGRRPTRASSAGESGLSGRERAVAGAVEHYREFLIGLRSMRSGGFRQGALSSRVLRRRRSSAGADFRHRHRPSRHQGQGAGGAGLRSRWAGSATASPPSPRPETRPRAMSPSNEPANWRDRGGRRSASSPSGKNSNTGTEPREQQHHPPPPPPPQKKMANKPFTCRSSS